MASMKYLVDGNPVRFPVVNAILGVGGHVVYEDPKYGTSWGLVEETDAPSVLKEIGVDMGVPGGDKTVITPMAVVDGVPVVAGASVVVPGTQDSDETVITKVLDAKAAESVTVPVVVAEAPKGKKPTVAL